jgi:hypothetical protein
MSKKQVLLAGIVLGAVGSIGLIFWMSRGEKPGRGLPGESDLRAAEPDSPPKLAKPSNRSVVWDSCETRKTPKYTVADAKDLEVSMNAGRVSSAAGVEYYILVEAPAPFRMTAEDAAALLEFYKKSSDKTVHEDKTASWSSSYWICSAYYPVGFPPGVREGATFQVSCSPGNAGRYVAKVFFGGRDGDAMYWGPVVFDTLAETLKDVEAKKTAKPSPKLW